MLMVYVNAELAERFFHDFAGLVMMPVAVSLMFGEIWLMDKIVEPDESARAHKERQGAIVRSRPARRVAPETP
jgi:hypothetical protein